MNNSSDFSNNNPIALITGGAGYIGGHVALELSLAGWNIVVLDNLSTGNRQALLPNAIFCEGDITDEVFVQQVFAAHNISAVLHLAAIASVPESVAEPQKCDKINRQGSANILAAARHHGVKYFIFSSTSAVYDENGTPPFAEDAALGPLSPYAETKLATEKMLAAEESPKFIILRYFNVGGCDNKQRAGNYKQKDTTLIKSALECAASKRSHLCLFGDDYPTADGSGVRDYVHVSDIARAHNLALEYLRGGGNSDIFNVGVGCGFSVWEVIAAVKDVCEVDFEVEVMPRREGDPAIVFCNPQKARKVLGFVAEHTELKDIIADAWAWERRLDE